MRSTTISEHSPLIRTRERVKRKMAITPSLITASNMEGRGDDVMVVANFSNVPQPSLNIGFPRGGLWHVQFNSDRRVYDQSFENGDSSDTMANPGGKDELNLISTLASVPIVS
jgi:hypothetical protein